MKILSKSVYFTSTSLFSADNSGNKHLNKLATLNGQAVVLQFVLRSDEDVKRSRNKNYKLLVP